MLTEIDVIINGLDPQVDLKIDKKKEIERDKEKKNPSTYIGRRMSHHQRVKELLQEEKGRCNRCGKFFKWTECKIYTPYGGYLDYEPPNDRYICNKCWNTMTKEEKKLIESIAWQKNW